MKNLSMLQKHLACVESECQNLKRQLHMERDQSAWLHGKVNELEGMFRECRRKSGEQDAAIMEQGMAIKE